MTDSKQAVEPGELDALAAFIEREGPGTSVDVGFFTEDADFYPLLAIGAADLLDALRENRRLRSEIEGRSATESSTNSGSRSVPQESERESEVMRALHDFRDAGGSAERVVAAIRGLMAPRSEGIEKDADEVRSALRQAARWFREYEAIHMAHAEGHRFHAEDIEAELSDDKAERNRDRAEFCEAALTSSRETGK